MDRMSKFQKWNTGYQDAHLFAFYGMNQAEVLISSANFGSNAAIRDGYSQALQTAYFAMNLLSQTDSNLDHRTRFFYMAERLDSLEVNMTWTIGLNDSQRSTLSKILYSIGDDILHAYTVYGDFSNANGWTLLWYSGPVPPDENLFNQADALMTNLPGLPYLLLP